MVIATSGKGSSISYTRIISSSDSYSVVYADSKTYRDLKLGLTKKLKGLFIIDINNIVALIWDYSYY